MSHALRSLLFCVLTGSVTVAQEPERPQITAVEPNTGVTSPGIRINIYGTGFSPDSALYFDGFEARELLFVTPSTIQVVTPYLRPGTYQLQLRSGDEIVKSDVTFTALPNKVDSEIDSAIKADSQGQPAAAVALLTGIAKTNPDHQVRAFAHYQAAQIYFSRGDLWRWGGEAAQIFDPAAGRAVQTSWRYRVASDQSDYLLPTNNEPDHDLKLADWTVKYDVTDNPEPRFHRSLVNARYGNLTKAKTDSDFILELEPRNQSYRALAAFIAMLTGDKVQLKSFSGEITDDALGHFACSVRRLT